MKLKIALKVFKNKILSDFYKIFHDEGLAERPSILTRLFFNDMTAIKLERIFFLIEEYSNT